MLLVYSARISGISTHLELAVQLKTKCRMLRELKSNAFDIEKCVLILGSLSFKSYR